MPRGEKGKRFTSEYQPKVRGRRVGGAKTFFDRIKIDMPDMVVRRGDYYEILEVLLSADREYISELAKDETIPVSILCIIKAIKTDMDEGTTKTIETLLTRVHGKPEQPIVGAEGKPLIPEVKLSREEIEKEIKRLEKADAE